jgi:futalosine hydrolase
MPKTLLIIAAAPREVEAILLGLGRAGWAGRDASGSGWALHRGRLHADHQDVDVHVLASGVGMANAAAATGWALGVHVSTHPGRASGKVASDDIAVLSLGVAGALSSAGHSSGESPPYACEIGDVVVSTASVFADTGLALGGGGFVPMCEIGFPLVASAGVGDRTHTDPEQWQPLPPDALRPSIGASLDASFRRGVIATVASCSASDAGAHAIAKRTGAIAEAMEGAGVGAAAHTLGVPWGEVRVISNTTGDRERQAWDLDAACTCLSEVTADIAAWCIEGDGWSASV